MDVKQTQTLAEIQEQMVVELAEQIKKDIDESVLLEALVEGGWTKVPLYFKNNEHAVDVMNWCNNNMTKNQWQRLGGSFIIRKKKEAEWFMLRWL